MSVRDIAVVGFAHAPHVRRTDGTTNGVEMLMPCFAQLYDELGITKPTSDSGVRVRRITWLDEHFRSSPRSTPSEPYRRSTNRTSRWTPPGHCMRPTSNC